MKKTMAVLKAQKLQMFSDYQTIKAQIVRTELDLNRREHPMPRRNTQMKGCLQFNKLKY